MCRIVFSVITLIDKMFCLADVSCIAKRCLFVVYILLFEGGLEGVERIGAFEECAADDMVGGRQRDGEFVFLRIEFGVLDVREPERLVGYGAFFHHGNRDQVAVDGVLSYFRRSRQIGRASCRERVLRLV